MCASWLALGGRTVCARELAFFPPQVPLPYRYLRGELEKRARCDQVAVHRTRTRTNTNPNGTEANASGRNASAQERLNPEVAIIFGMAAR
jgi:hypothetical protein